MKKQIALLSAAVMSLATLTACEAPGATSLVETSETSVTTTEVAPPVAEYPICYTSADTAEIDLDGDGSVDTIKFTLGNEDEYTSAILNVNGKDYETLPITPDKFWVCDIDTSDKFLELAVSTYGMSDDYATSFYRLEDGVLVNIGQIEDMLDDSLKTDFNLSPMFSKHAIFNGDGTITASHRLYIFQTWFSYTTYTYNPAKDIISEHSDIYYPYGEENKDNYKSCFDMIFAGVSADELNVPTTTAEIHLYSDMNKSSSAVTLAPQHFMATATDDVNWVYIVGEDGTSGWLFVSSWDTACDAVSGDFKYMDVMENLFLYD